VNQQRLLNLFGVIFLNGCCGMGKAVSEGEGEEKREHSSILKGL